MQYFFCLLLFYLSFNGQPTQSRKHFIGNVLIVSIHFVNREVFRPLQYSIANCSLDVRLLYILCQQLHFLLRFWENFSVPDQPLKPRETRKFDGNRRREDFSSVKNTNSDEWIILIFAHIESKNSNRFRLFTPVYKLTSKNILILDHEQ